MNHNQSEIGNFTFNSMVIDLLMKEIKLLQHIQIDLSHHKDAINKLKNKFTLHDNRDSSACSNQLKNDITVFLSHGLLGKSIQKKAFS